jgi:hypothetical protein
MMLMQLEAPTDSEGQANQGVSANFEDSEDRSARMPVSSLRLTLAQQQQADRIWQSDEDYDLLFALSFARAELLYLCGHHQSAFAHFQLLMTRTKKQKQLVDIYRQLIRLKTIAGDYLSALQLAIKGLSLLGVHVQGLSIGSSKKVTVDDEYVRQMFGELQTMLKEFERKNVEEQRHRASAEQTDASPVHAHKMSQSVGECSSDDSRDPDESTSYDESDDDDEHLFASAAGASTTTGGVARLTIRSLLHHLPLCSDERQVLVGELLLESVFPAHMLNALVLQHVALSSVIHSMKHGLSGNEGFSFAMVGASLLATRIDDTQFVAADAQEWGKLGLRFCLKYNNQMGYCRTLMANALFINSWTGHLEQSILELQQAIYIGSLVGDQLFVAQSSLARVMLQQYTSSLPEWEQMLQQAEMDNSQLLQDYAVAKYTQGMKLILPSLMSAGQSTDKPAYGVHISPAESRFIEELQLESGGESSLHLTLYSITKVTAKRSEMGEMEDRRERERDCPFEGRVVILKLHDMVTWADIPSCFYCCLSLRLRRSCASTIRSLP